jgi:GntR family transcriptional regulator of vanillate catabolism
MLLRGALRPGQRIAEIPLSIKLGVSCTPLRLAFEKLEHEGLVKALLHSGFAASEFSMRISVTQLRPEAFWKAPPHGSQPND